MESAFLEFMVTLYDPHGDEHAANCSDLAAQLAARCDLNKQDILRIRSAAKHHDVGKICIPESIRRFPGTYTPLEWYAMQKHCEVGAQMLQLLDFDEQVIGIVLSHHENFDGTGYPSMLRGNHIPLGARIIRIVDSFDAVTHDRGYRRACSQKRALEKLNERSAHYDPELLTLFARIIEETWTAKP